MNTKLLSMALECSLLNGVDNETPAHYFVSGWAEKETVDEFAQLIIKEIESYIEYADGDIDYVRFLIDTNLKS